MPDTFWFRGAVVTTVPDTAIGVASTMEDTTNAGIEDTAIEGVNPDISKLSAISATTDTSVDEAPAYPM